MTISFLEALFEKIKETIRENFLGLSGRFVLLESVHLVFTGSEKGSGVVSLSNGSAMSFSFHFSFPFSVVGFPEPTRKVLVLDNVSFFPTFSD